VSYQGARSRSDVCTKRRIEMFEVVRPQPPMPGLNLEPQRHTEVRIRRGLSCATGERDKTAATSVTVRSHGRPDVAA
jgi:hypothetical protein